MHIPLHERRGLNRQQAIAYLGVKGSYFDDEIRPKLHGIRLGTSVIFDRRDLDMIFDQLKMAPGDVGPTEKGVSKWPKEPQVSIKQKTDAGGSTKRSTDLVFKDVIARLKKQKNG